PVTMLLLAASDQLSAVVASATGNASNRFINFSTGSLAGLTVAAGPFMAIFLGVFVVAGAVVLWIELLMREAAVYVIVLMLPLAFAGMVWPARRKRAAASARSRRQRPLASGEIGRAHV